MEEGKRSDESASATESGSKSRRPEKRSVKNEIRMYPKELEDQRWINEFVGDERIVLEKPRAWKSIPLIGMDKVRAKSDMGKYFVDFAGSSTIHGFNHLTAPHRHPLERILAVLFILGALICLILLSINFWQRYQNAAVILVIDNDYRNFTITAPSVLVCPVRKYDEDKFPSVFKRHGIEDTEEARAFFRFLAESSYADYESTPRYSGVPSSEWLSVLWDLKRDVVTDSPEQNSRIWIVTEKGFCLLFFSYVSDYSSYEYWRENNWTVVPPPNQLRVYTYAERDHVETMNILTDSVMMSTFHPTETPDPEKPAILIGQRHHITIGIAPKEIKTSLQVKALSVKQRNCRQSDEGDLETWPVYSQFMCAKECKFELIRELCGCYPHFARPMPGVPVCNVQQLICVGRHRPEIVNVHSTVGKRCLCLPNCDTALYENEIDSDAELKEGSPTDAFINYHIDFPVELIHRELLFGFADFLASVGGAAGLFLGASVISFIEIFYYLTLRLFWYRVGIRKRKRNRSRTRKIAVQRIDEATKY